VTAFEDTCAESDDAVVGEDPDAAQRLVVERVLIVTEIRIGPLPVTLGAWAVEAVHRGAYRLAAASADRSGQVVGEGGLSRGVRAVDGDAQRVGPPLRAHRVGEQTDRLGPMWTCGVTIGTVVHCGSLCWIFELQRGTRVFVDHPGAR
jgi:hypothetical protein